MNTPSWPYSVFEPVKRIDTTAYYLRDLARAFYATGNEKIGDALMGHASNLRDDTKAISDAVGDHINAGYREAVESSATVLKAVLAGAQMEREGGEKS